MLYREYPTSSRLAPFVECFWTLRAPARHAWESIYPDGCAELVFNLSEPAEELRRGEIERQPRYFVYGPTEERIQVRGSLGTELLAVRFKPWGASALVGIPGDELAGRSIPLEAISGALAKRMISIVEAGTAVERKTAQLDACLRTWMDSQGCEVPATAPLARYLQTTPAATVRDVSRLTGWGSRTAQRRFRADVGLTPKRFVQVVRFMRFMRLMDVEPAAPLSHLAVAAGYYDQPHLHRDLRRFTGATPATFREKRGAPFDYLYGRERLEHLVSLPDE